MKTKSLDESMTNWRGSHTRVAAAYGKGIDRADNWQANAIAAKDLYAAKIAESIANGSREKGIAGVSNEEWKRRAKDKGQKRIVDGMKASDAKMSQGLGKVLAALAEVNLPARTADPMENLVNRAGAVVQRLAALKKE